MEDVLRRQLERADERWMRHWLEGPTRTEHPEVPVQVGDPAPDVELIDHEGNPVKLSDFWSRGPLHLFLLRHYGCSCMKERWEQLLPAEFVIDRAGIIRHVHRYQYCEDFPPVTVLVGAILAAAGA